MFGNFDEEARKVLAQAKKEMIELKHPYVGSEHLILSILKNKNDISNKLKEYNLTYDKFKKEIINIIGLGTNETECFLYTPLLKRVIENAILDSRENNQGEVTINHLFSSFLEEGEGVAIRIMLGMNIDLEKLYNEFAYKIIIQKSKNGRKLMIDEFGIDLTKKAKNNELDPVIGRDIEIKRVIEILSRRCKNNPLLIGPAGVGKTAIIEGLAYLISIMDVPLNLQNKRIISLDMASLVAGTKYRGEFEERIRKILKEVEENDDIILFIDEVHTLVGAGGAEGAIDASNIFKPALARGKIRVIGSTTIDEYKKFIENDKALARRFQNVNISIPNNKTVQNILFGLKPIYEEYHKVIIPDDIITLIIDLSEKYIHNRNQPDKAIDILDEVCAYVSLKENKEVKKYNNLNKELNLVVNDKNECIKNGEYKKALAFREKEHVITGRINDLELSLNKNKKDKFVTKYDVTHVINAKTGIPVYEILSDNIKIIKEIESKLNKQIIGQDKALYEAMNIIKRIKLGFKDDNKCYSLLFCGPSGVGKTKLATLFSSLLTDNMIKLDMSEYSDSSSVTKIVGSSPGYIGYDDNKNILEEVKNKPYSVLILDEIEKAHPSVLNLFLQILDEGKIKNSKGEYVYFNNIVIIMTSNVGFEKTDIGFNKNNNNLSSLKEQFSLPFINRIDSVINFNYLDKESIKKIIDIKINSLKKKYKNKNIKVKISNCVIEDIINMSSYASFGARKIDKIIKDKVENLIISNVINNNFNIEIKKLDKQTT